MPVVIAPRLIVLEDLLCMQRDSLSRVRLTFFWGRRKLLGLSASDLVGTRIRLRHEGDI